MLYTKPLGQSYVINLPDFVPTKLTNKLRLTVKLEEMTPKWLYDANNNVLLNKGLKFSTTFSAIE